MSKHIRLVTSIPGPRSKELMHERTSHVARGPFHSTPIFMNRARNALIEDVDGNTFIDMAAGLGVTNVGHAPDLLVKAVQEQAAKVLHAGFNVTAYEGYVRVAAALNKLTPGCFAKKTLLINTGAEAVENAVKIARAHTKRQAIVCFEHGYHGRTYMAMTLTSKVMPYREGFGPFNSDVYRVPFPYTYRWPNSSDEGVVTEECFKQFEQVVTTQIGVGNTAAVIIEPVQGEGGFIPVPVAFMKKLREFCTANGIVLIADEVQTGFGRTGTLFACEQLGVEADLYTLAKGLGGGLPLAAVTGRAEMMDAPVVGGVGGTYGGNPLACASALAVFKTFEDGSLLNRAKTIGKTISARTRKWSESYAAIGDARGLGPMQAIELVKDRKLKTPNKEATGALQRYCYEHGVVILTAGTFGNVVRFLVPLSIEDEVLAEALDVIEAGIRSL